MEPAFPGGWTPPPLRPMSNIRNVKQLSSRGADPRHRLERSGTRARRAGPARGARNPFRGRSAPPGRRRSLLRLAGDLGARVRLTAEAGRGHGLRLAETRPAGPHPDAPHDEGLDRADQPAGPLRRGGRRGGDALLLAADGRGGRDGLRDRRQGPVHPQRGGLRGAALVDRHRRPQRRGSGVGKAIPSVHYHVG